MSDWCTSEIKQFMDDMLSRRATYVQIAMEVNKKFKTNITRNAALGKCQRMGLKSKNKRTDRYKKPKERKVAVRTVRFIAPSVRPPKPPPKERPSLNPNWVEPIGVDVRDLADGDCHWPLGGFSARPPYKYCGEKKFKGSMYCHHHYTESLRSTEVSQRYKEKK